MAEGGEGGASAEDKTEAPSQRRLDKSREEGEAAVSREAVQFASLGGGALGIAMLAPGAASNITAAAAALLARAAHDAGAWEGLAGLLAAAAPVLGVVAAAGGAALAATFIQTQLLVSAKSLIPKFSRLSPIGGAKRLFGRAALEELVRTLLKLGACVGAAWWGVLEPAREATLAVLSLPMAELAATLMALGLRLLLTVLAALAVVAALDVLWVRWRHMSRLRMSREEMRHEAKDSEGDPHLKGRRLQIMRQRSRRRALAEVPKATVVVTNPTHFAIALAYDRGKDAAPRLVAKGADLMAKRIREAAEAHGVPIVSNPPLARALFLVEEGEAIPAEHFTAVAEVIAFVWRLRSGRHAAV